MSLDIPQLNTASTYINNLLLARGLLRNGKAINFAALGASERRDATKEQDSKKSSKSAERAANVINLVHDLILRRDRETDQLNSLSETLTELRSTATVQSSQIDRLKTQNQELSRQLNTTQSSLKSTHTSLHTAESTAKALREELAKVKGTLTHVRTQCTNDVRKRDVQIQRLKGHLSSSQRGSNGRAIGPTCTISGGGTIGKAWVGTAGSTGTGSSRGEEESPPSLEDVGYSLKQETTEFLTQLSQNLSDENDSLIALVRSTLRTLRELQNLPPAGVSISDTSHGGQDSEDSEIAMVQVLPTSFETLSTDLEYVLTNLRVILTNASFVPIDEVYARDEEINRLKEGWERMEKRWREAVDMMKGWQERMLSGGGTVNLEELKLGLGLGNGLEYLDDSIECPSSSRANSEAREEDSLVHDLPEDEPSFMVEDENIVLQARGNADDHLFDEVERSSSPLGPPPVSTVLKESTLNMRVLSPQVSTPARKSNIQQENPASADLVHNGIGYVGTISSTPTHSKASKTNNEHTGQKINNSRSGGRRASINPSSLRGWAKVGPSKRIAARNGPLSSHSKIHRTSSSTPPKDGGPHSESLAVDPEPPLTIEQKLEHAESEARRVSGSSVSDSPSPKPAADEIERQAQLSNNKVTADINESQQGNNGEGDGPPEIKAAAAKSAPSAASTATPTITGSTLRNRGTATGSGASNSSESRALPAKTRATASTAASRAGTLARRGHTSTRIPTKPAAPDGPVNKGNEESKRIPETAKRPSSVEATLRRGRRKRKSTLSPDELEELMGLRRRAEAEAEATLEMEGNATRGDCVKC